MSKIITFSRQFPAYHPKAGQPTFFVEKFWQSIYFQHCGWKGFFDLGAEFDLALHDIYTPKHHTIREGYRFKNGDYFSPRAWGTDINPKSGRIGPYQSKQIIIGPDTLVTDTWDFEIDLISPGQINLSGVPINAGKLIEVAENDGLNACDLQDWFKYPKPFSGQIICWNEKIKY